MDDIDRFLAEDIGSGDVTSRILLHDGPGCATIVCEEDAVVAGLEEAVDIFGRMGTVAVNLVEDGAIVTPGTEVLRITGPVRNMITAERTALNMMMRMSGIATAVHAATKLCRAHSESVMISGTRKTTPGFRNYEKKAIGLGGGEPHRLGLYDMILVKDNHISALGGLGKVMERISRECPDVKVEVEVENAHDATVAAEYGVDMIMLDNRTPEEASDLYALIKSIDRNIIVEVSGRITMDNVERYARCADRISMGCITHSVRSVHFSMVL